MYLILIEYVDQGDISREVYGDEIFYDYDLAIKAAKEATKTLHNKFVVVKSVATVKATAEVTVQVNVTL